MVRVYDINDTFHEPLLLFSWLAAITELEFATGILVAPQRQTALLAKQAAELDLLTGGGRLRLGLGIGWNGSSTRPSASPSSTGGPARGADHPPAAAVDRAERHLRGAVRHRDRGRHRPASGNPPHPAVARGGGPRRAGRIGRLADGWFAMLGPGHGLEQALEVIADAAVGAGPTRRRSAWRDRPAGPSGPRAAPDREAEHWGRAGATHLTLNTMSSGCVTVDDHISAMAAAVPQLAGSAG